jgi:hypothetical protein
MLGDKVLEGFHDPLPLSTGHQVKRTLADQLFRPAPQQVFYRGTDISVEVLSIDFPDPVAGRLHQIAKFRFAFMQCRTGRALSNQDDTNHVVQEQRGEGHEGYPFVALQGGLYNGISTETQDEAVGEVDPKGGKAKVDRRDGKGDAVGERFTFFLAGWFPYATAARDRYRFILNREEDQSQPFQ